MEDSIRYIEDYFEGQLTAEDRQAFERKCELDPSFAQEVALYLNMRGALRAAYYENKKKDLESFAIIRSDVVRERGKSVPLLLWVSGIAATILIVAVVLFFSGKPDPEQLASAYIDQNLTTLSVTMGVEQDSLALGVNAYNDQNFELAEEIFTDLLKYPSVQFNATKNLGIVALAKGDYAAALKHFEDLSQYAGMHANPGMFYKAVTLMKRAESQDVQQAKEILAIVVRDRMAGHKEAERWLEALD